MVGTVAAQKKFLFATPGRILFAVVLGICLTPFVLSDAYSSTPSALPFEFAKLEVVGMPVLNEEFELVVSIVPDDYNKRWEEASDGKRWAVTFTVVVPQSFEIVDDDFVLAGRNSNIPDGYDAFSATRDVGYPLQTTVRIIPAELGIWQIGATGDQFIPGKIFLTLTEHYSYVSYKSGQSIKKTACGQEPGAGDSNITVFDLDSGTAIQNIQDSFMSERYRDWTILGDSASGLAYVYEYYETTIPVLDLGSGKIAGYLDFPNAVLNMVRIADMDVNTQTGLAYLADSGRHNSKSEGRLIAIDGAGLSVASHIMYKLSEEGDPMRDIAVNPQTNTLYGMSGSGHLYAINLDTGQSAIGFHLDRTGQDGFSQVVDIKINSKTNMLYILDSGNSISRMFAVDGSTNRLLDTLQYDGEQTSLEINEEVNEIYLYSLRANTLRIIDGADLSETAVISLFNPYVKMGFDHAGNRLYIANSDSSITIIDVDSLEVDIGYYCRNPTGMFLDSDNRRMYLTGDYTQRSVNVLDAAHVPTNPGIEIRTPYPRNEFLQGEDLEILITFFDDQNIRLDSATVKNLDEDQRVFAFSGLEPASGNSSHIGLDWNQTDGSGEQAVPGNYALLLRGIDDDGIIYEAHMLFSIIDEEGLNELQHRRNAALTSPDTDPDLQAIDEEMSGSTGLADNDDMLTGTQALELRLTLKEQLALGVPPQKIKCGGDTVLVLVDGTEPYCVNPSTAKKLVLRGWDVTPQVSGDNARSDDNVPSSSDRYAPRNHESYRLDFPLSSKFVDNGIAKFNVEISHAPMLNEEFEITIRYEVLLGQSAKPHDTVPFTLTLGDGIQYVRGDMAEVGRTYSLATEKYNTMYSVKAPSVALRAYESTSTLKFTEPGENNFGVLASGQFDAFWFFVDADDRTVRMKDEIRYDYRALSQLLQRLAVQNPDAINAEMEEIFAGDARQVLEEYYEYFEYRRPTAPVDMSTTKVQLRDVVCSNNIFYKFLKTDITSSKGIYCGSESSLEYYSAIPLVVYDRDAVMQVLTINSGPADASRGSIIAETSNVLQAHHKLQSSRELGHDLRIVVPPPYNFAGAECSNNALYASFEVPMHAKIGEAFEVALTYGWRLANPLWEVLSDDDRGAMLEMHLELIPLLQTWHLNDENPDTLTGGQLHDLEDRLDSVENRMSDILDKYEIQDTDVNAIGYGVALYYPECSDPVLDIAFPEEVGMLSEGFEITGKESGRKIVTYSGEKILPFSNDGPQTLAVRMVVNEPAFDLVSLLKIDVAGHKKIFAFSTDGTGAVTFANAYPDYLERLAFVPEIDKFGNKIPPHKQQNGGGSSFDSVLYEFARLNDMSLEDINSLQIEFIKHQILNPRDDFTTFYKTSYGDDISSEIDYVKLGPPMEDVAEFLREYVSKSGDVEEWLYSDGELHPDWIEEFLMLYPEFKR